MPTAENIAKFARYLTGSVAFRKRLPKKFGGASIYVTSSSDIRLLKPGLEAAAQDLFLVAEKYIQPGNCVWDIGSNLGIFAFCAAFRAGEGGRVFSLEADPKYAEFQHMSIAQLPIDYAPVSVLSAAIADSLGVLELEIPKKGHSRNHLSVVSGNAAGETAIKKQVATITGDFLVDHWKHPDFVKIDVEGAELLALQGSASLLSRVRPVFYIEVNTEVQDDVTNLLNQYDYKLFSLDKAGVEQSIDRCEFNNVAKPAETC